MKYTQTVAFKWAISINKSLRKHGLFLKQIINQVKKYCKKNKQKNKPTIENRLINILPLLSGEI